jgi:hypothetical protein
MVRTSPTAPPFSLVTTFKQTNFWLSLNLVYIRSAGIPAIAGIIADANRCIFYCWVALAARAMAVTSVPPIDGVPALLHVVIAVFTVVFSVDFLYLLLLVSLLWMPYLLFANFTPCIAGNHDVHGIPAVLASLLHVFGLLLLLHLLLLFSCLCSCFCWCWCPCCFWLSC